MKPSRLFLVALPPLVAILLSIPCFRFPYVWDDFVFLRIGQTFHASYLLPVPETIFYRPISREIYFGLLTLFPYDGAFLAHILNAAVLVVAIVLLISFATRLCDFKVGFLSGLAFACLSFVPILVGWISTIQDLLAIVFILAALQFQLGRRAGLAALATACAMLSKESALFLMPVLILSHWIIGERPYRIARNLTLYGAIAVLWAAIHPGLHLMAGRGFAGGEMRYLGLDNPGRAEFLWRSLLTLVNLPITGLRTPWLKAGTLPLVGAALAASVGVWALYRRGDRSRPHARPGPRRAAVLAGLITVIPTVLTCLTVRTWEPYYSALPAVGSSILLGILLSRQRPLVVGMGAAALLALGVWCRGVAPEPTIIVERNLQRTSAALARVERGFKRLRPNLPHDSRVYLSVMPTGPESVHHHLRRLQALRVWYRDPSIVTLRLAGRVPGPEPDFLFWVAPNFDVIEIDPETLRPRGSGGKPEYPQYQKTIRSHALGLSGAGDTDRAVAVLLGMPKMSARDSMLDYRMAAMMLLADGRRDEVPQLLSGLRRFERREGIELIGDLLAQPVQGRNFEESALEAFGFRPDDIDVWRDLMRGAKRRGYVAQTLRFARRIQTLRPGDLESAALIEEASRSTRLDRWFGGALADSL